MPLPSCSLANLFDMLFLYDFLPLLASGKIGYAVGADVDGFELSPFQTFLAKVGCFFAPLRRRGLCTPLADGLLLPHIQAVRASSFEGIRAVVGNAWNVDLAMAETVSAETIRALNTAYEDLAPFLAAVPDHLCNAYLLQDVAPLDSGLPLRFPSVALPSLTPGARGSGMNGRFFILWVTFKQVDYLVTFGALDNFRVPAAEPGRSSSFAEHAGYAGPFDVIDSDE